MRIEKPDWYSLGVPTELGCSQLAIWFTEHVEPINKMLAEGVAVYCSSKHFNSGITVNKTKIDTHSAILINIKPIKRESASDVLRDFLAGDPMSMDMDADEYCKFFHARAKAALGDE